MSIVNIYRTYQNSQSEKGKKKKKGANERADYVKCEKTLATKARLILVLPLIGWESGGSFEDQSQSEVKHNRSDSESLSSFIKKWLYKQSAWRITR